MATTMNSIEINEAANQFWWFIPWTIYPNRR